MSENVESVGYQLSTAQFERFRQLVGEHAGIALRPEKQQLVCSRLARRLRALGLTSFDEYYALIAREGDHGEELEQLLNAITTNKTSFFREAHHFDELRNRVVLPKLRDGAGSLQLRVWSAGCSTGEEPYSIVTTLLDAIPNWQSADIRVLASDLDSNVLTVAERGVYALDKLEELPDGCGRRWFIAGSGDKAGFIRARRELRERVAFRRINFVDPVWPVKACFDAVFCRNALIYFDTDTQKRIVERLLGYLKPGGLLLLGHSESMAGVRADLQSLGRTTYEYLGARQ